MNFRKAGGFVLLSVIAALTLSRAVAAVVAAPPLRLHPSPH